MKNIIFVLLFSLACFAQDTQTPTNKAVSDTPAPLSRDQKLALYAQRDAIDPSLNKLQAQPIWKEYSDALNAKSKADAALDIAKNKILASPEGKEYVKAADDYSASLTAIYKGVDQTKWRLGVGYIWERIPEAPATKPASDSKEKK
jgi:hypothetical protein